MSYAFYYDVPASEELLKNAVTVDGHRCQDTRPVRKGRS